MRHFQPFSAIVDALRDSTFLELADDDTAVRRRKAWEPTVDNTAAMRRSIYAKGFGEEVPSTQFDIEAYFAEFGATNEVRLRRSEEKIFKGSVFVEFETEELAAAFLEQENKPKYKGNDLQIMSKKEYCDKKSEDIKAGKIKPNTSYGKGGKPYDRDRRGDSKRKRDDEDDRDWRTRRDEDRKRGYGDDKRRGGDRRRGAGHGGGRSGGPTTDDK
jgi:lupus La protein